MENTAPAETLEAPLDAVNQLAEGQLDHSAASLLEADHLVASKRNNIQLAKQNTFVTSAGNTVIFYDITTGSKKYVLGRDGGGIGCIAVHPTEPLIAVAEQCKVRAPNVYLYSLSEASDLQLQYVLKAGTEHSYSAVAFNKEGNLLATVGGAPDYMLTLWNWQKESVILRHKAFSQEVYNASFSPFFDGKLITSGTGHIRMWNMAATFTGLKLVGLLGKFGQVELSDVCAYLEFSDGKVLSGTESGQLLLWAGNLIKAVFMRHGHRTCHDGNVEVLALHQGGCLVVSAGQDGYIRTWDASKINEVEPEDGYEVEISMITEVQVPGGARIKSIVDAGDFWMLQDESGSIIHVTVPEISLDCMDFTKLWSFHSGGISTAVLDRDSHACVSVDTAGSIWSYSLQSREALATRQFPQGVTCLIRAHASTDSNQSVFFMGHEHGFIRQVIRCSDGWRLAACFRPHKSSVIALSCSPSGTELVSCGGDRTLFFFTLNDGLIEPHGFTTLPSSATSAVWTTQGVIVGCDNGTLLCVAPPEGHDHVSAATYEFQAEISQQNFILPQSLWPPPPKKEEGEGEEGVVQDEAENSNKEQEVDNWVPSPEEIGPFPIVALFHHPTDSGRFLLSVSGNASHHLFDMSSITGEPIVHMGMSAAITSVQHSYSGVHLVTGSCDGAVRVTAVQPFTFARKGDAFWETQVHDMHHRVTSACVTFDGTALISTASDGAMFSHKLVHEALVPGQPQAGLENERFCMLEDCISPEAEDIADNNAYTIEQAKQQLEKDMLMATAEAKKTAMRQAIAQIKKEFEQLLAENAAKPEGEQLPLSYFDIDPGMRAMIEEEIQQEEEQVRAEMQHELEKNTILLSKVKAKFLDPLEVERIELHALGKRAMVTSFRTAKLEEWVEQELQSMLKERQNAAAATEDAELLQDHEPTDKMWTTNNNADAHVSTKQGSKSKQVSKHELRQQARAKRKAEWEAFLNTKPDDNYVNPVDAEAIIEATRNMGDYKLKSEKNYVPDENKRMTPKRKKQQIAMLLQGIFTVKMEFNERFLALRDVKQAVCAELQGKYSDLERLNSQLGINEVVQAPCMQPAEEPERREEVTDEDIAAYIAAQEAAAEAAAANNLDGFAGGGGGSGGAQGDKPASGEESKPGTQGTENKQPNAGGKPPETPKKANGETRKALAARLSAQYPMTPMEKTQRAILERNWGVERDLLLKRINEMTSRFDEALMKLRREKIDLEMNLKAAEVQLLVLVQEHGLLVEFSARDDALAGKLAEKQAEQRDILSKINACQLQLKDHRNQLEKVAKRKAEIAAYFDSVVNENHPHRDPLFVIFNRKVKRAKKNVANDRDDEDDEDADSDGEDDSDDDEQQEVCPHGCDQALYDEVCVIREQRLDQEDVITEISKSCEQAKKEQETLKQKLKRIEQSLAATETDIREFQQEKQASLNEIDVMIMLHAHQIEYLVDGKLPADLKGAVVFSNKELARLRKRIDELAAEKLQMRKTQKELRKQHQQLTKDRSAKEKILTDLEARAHDVQMLKFGREVDLDLLEQLGPTPGADDLRAQLREQEKAFIAELKEWDQKISMRTEELVALTQENTIHLNTVGELTSQQKALESGIRRTRKELNSDPVAAQKQEAAERDHLIHLIQSQAKEIDYIKSQIDVLKRKDTSVFQ